ncbi:unnamed protein product [Linum tenue]|uniref:glyoxylate reductase (NADP(+)) n=1 Tax=Linum tenue TaxID=586396 RepID=A0AAV0KN57_9ROSI|nr:unnamed protein product [Linum tenue]
MTKPIYSYLQAELEKRFKVLKLWEAQDGSRFLEDHNQIIRAVVSDGGTGLSPELMAALPKLEIVSSFSVGMDKIDLGKCKEKGIRVSNTPDVLTDDVADLAIGLTLAVLRKLPASDRYVRSGMWKKALYCEMLLYFQFSGKSVGIVGLGRIGQAIATRAEGFGCKISYHSRTPKPESSNYTYYPSVVDLAAHSDILVVACALTNETRHIINREVIDALGPRGVLVNIARGATVDEPELVSALVEGRLGGAGLDVFENEPNVPEQLIELDEKVVLAPHAGSGTEETRKGMADLVVGNLVAHFEGKELLTPVV